METSFQQATSEYWRPVEKGDFALCANLIGRAALSPFSTDCAQKTNSKLT
jgi:hypothetical protein